MAARLPDWRNRLSTEIASAASRPWQWGAGGRGEPHDCLAFSARCVLAVTGIDLYEPFRGRYNSEASAAELVPDVGDYMAELAEAQGWPQIEPREALDGDLAFFDRGGIAMVGVIYGRLIFADKPRGVRTVTRFVSAVAWGVGFDG